MSEPVKSNDEIREQPDEARAVLARARAAFQPIDGVLSVGLGQKESGGAYHDQIAIVVVVREKRRLEELAPEERIPPVFEGYPTDVVVRRDTVPLACNNNAQYDVIQGGIQIAPTMKRVDSLPLGTLGCIVRRRGDSSRENVYLLSCKHVLFADGAGEGDYAYHPYPPLLPGFVQPGPINVLGPIQAASFYENRAYRAPGDSVDTQYFIDCATARLDIDSKCFGSTCTKDTTKYSATIIDLALGVDDASTPVREDNMIVDVRNVIDDVTLVGQRVYKVGRTTGRTVGIVRRLNGVGRAPADFNDLDGPRIDAEGLIEIDFDTDSTPEHVNCNGNERFAEGGDSGSLLLDEQRRAIGIVSFAPPVRVEDPIPRAAPAFACHILPILDALRVCIATTGGTSRGSCAAVDGSGTSPASLTTADLPADDGQIHFTSSGALGSRVRVPQPIPITESERDRMLVLRDALRETAYGRELHATFADVRREIGYLVRNVRPVKVAWNRHQGPAFLAHVLNHLKGDSDTIPHEINEVSRDALLLRMGEVLATHGSKPLRAAIERYNSTLREVLNHADTVQDGLAALRERESIDANEVLV